MLAAQFRVILVEQCPNVIGWFAVVLEADRLDFAESINRFREPIIRGDLDVDVSNQHLLGVKLYLVGKLILDVLCGKVVIAMCFEGVNILIAFAELGCLLHGVEGDGFDWTTVHGVPLSLSCLTGGQIHHWVKRVAELLTDTVFVPTVTDVVTDARYICVELHSTLHNLDSILPQTE